MRCFPCAASCLLAWMLAAICVRAEAPPSPLRLLPDSADLVIQATEPRHLLEMLTDAGLYKQVQQLAPVREFFDSTNVRRFRQLTVYFEKELGLPWPELLDRLASRGVALSAEFGPSPAPMLLVAEGSDEELLRRFFQLALKIIEQELLRQEAKEKPVKGSYKGFDTVRIGTEFHAAVAGRALFVSNSEKALHGGLDRYSSSGKSSMADASGIREAARLLPPQPLVSAWLNMHKIRQSPEAKAAYQSPPRDDPFQTVLFGHYLDLLGRSPFVCAGIYRQEDGFVTTIRIPRGRDGMGADKLLHLPPSGAPGSRPLLEPKNVLYSESNYFDLANVWKERKTLFNEKQVKQLEKFEKQAGKFLLGTKLGKLLTKAGPYYRFVAVHQPKISYKTTPRESIPAFALIWEMREPEALGKSMETILRGVALLASSQVNLKIVEEQYRDCKLVGYRFPEGQPLEGDADNSRFNFTPCFARVGDQLVVSSTIDLCRELVDLLHKEGNAPSRGHASTGRARLYGPGVAAYLQTREDLLVTQAALDRTATPAEARQGIKTFLDIIRGLGVLVLEPRYHEKMFQYDIRLQLEK